MINCTIYYKITKMPDFQLLSRSPLFAGIAPDILEKLLGSIPYQMKKFTKEVMVVTAGDEVNHLLVLQKGTVKGEMTDYSGKILKIENIEAPRPLAIAFLFGHKRQFPVTVTTLTETEIIYLPISSFLTLMQANQKILLNYLNAISSQTQFLSGKLHLLSFKSIREKIAHFMLQSLGPKESVFVMQQTQQELADLLGATRPALARVLGEMQREGLFSIDKKTVQIPDRQLLRRLLN